MYAFQEQFLCTRREEQTPRALDDHSTGNCRRPDEAIPGFQARGTRSRTIEMSHNTGNSTDVPAGVGSGKGKPSQHVSTMGNPSHWDSLRLRIGKHRARSEFCFSSYCSTQLCLGCGSRHCSPDVSISETSLRQGAKKVSSRFAFCSHDRNHAQLCSHPFFQFLSLPGAGAFPP